MEKREKQEKKPLQQTAENPSGSSVGNPFENNQSVNNDLEIAREELEKEQEFKEAQTERD
jgi:hypothetical protein